MDPPGRAPRRAGGCPRRGGRRRRESRRRESRRQVGVQVGVQVDVQVDVFALARRVRHQGGREARRSAALADADVSATATWQDASRAIANDPRRDALKTAGEKRRCLHEYQARRGKEDRAARRAEKAARDAFSEILVANAPRTARSTGFEPTTSGRRRARILVSGTSRTGFEPTRGSSRFATRRREKICSARFSKTTRDEGETRDARIAATPRTPTANSSSNAASTRTLGGEK